MPDVEQILVPVSSGGFASGIATAVKLTAPQVRVIGVQPERANAYFVSRQAGEPTAIEYWDSLADGLSARRPGEFPFQHLQEYLDDVVLISEAQLARAFRTVLFRTKLLVEPAGVVGGRGISLRNGWTRPCTLSQLPREATSPRTSCSRSSICRVEAACDVHPDS